jgi:hypothetical protein
MVTAPYFIENYQNPGTPTANMYVGRAQFVRVDFSGSPTSYDWFVFNDTTSDLLANGTFHTTPQTGDSDSWTPGDELEGVIVRLKVVATNGSGSSALVSSTLTWTVTTIGTGMTIAPDPISAFTRTSATTEIPCVVSLTYSSRMRDGYIQRFNVYSDAAKSNLLSTLSYATTYAQAQAGAHSIDLTAIGLSYTATDWIEAVVETTSPAALFHTFSFATAISPTDAVIPMTWSSTDKTSNATISGGSLTVTENAGSGQYATVRSSRAVGFNKTYAEFTVNHAICEVGVCDGGVAFPGPGSGVYWGLSAFPPSVATSHAVGWHGNDSQIYYNNTNQTVASFTAGDIISIAWDRVNELIWFRKNGGAWVLSGDPAAGTNGVSATGLDPGSYFYAQPGPVHAVTANFGTTSGGTAGFTYTPPTGFVAP